MIRTRIAAIIFLLGITGFNLPAKAETTTVPDGTPVVSGTGKTYYVGPNGSDTNPGTKNLPWRTIQYAGRIAGGGDTVLIRAGSYGEGGILLRADQGDCGNKKAGLLTIRNAPSELVLLTNGNQNADFTVKCNYLRVQGLNFRNGKSLQARGVDRDTLQFVNNTFKGSGYHNAAIVSEGSNILIEGNECDISGNTAGTQGHCYYVEHGSNIIVRNNIAKGPTGYGIHIFDQDRKGDPPLLKRLIQNVLIEGNTASNSEQRAGIIVAAYDHAQIENVIIRNNVVYNNNGMGIVIRSKSRNIKVYNNTIFHNGGHAIGIEPVNGNTVDGLDIQNNILVIDKECKSYHIDKLDMSTTQDLTIKNNFYGTDGCPKDVVRLHNVTDAKPRNGSPKFVNPDTYDLHLQPASPAIGQGVDLAEVSFDKDGGARPQGAYDMGAYEFQKNKTH